MVTKEGLISSRQSETERYIRSTLPTLYTSFKYYAVNPSTTNTFLSEDGMGTILTGLGALRVGQGVIFDGIDDRIRTTVNLSVLRPASNFTMICWFKPSAGCEGYVCGTPWTAVWGIPFNAYQFYYQALENFTVQWNIGGVQNDYATYCTFPAVSGKWHMVAYAFDGTTHFGYLNGIPVFNYISAGSISYNASPLFCIGFDSTGAPAEFCKGTMGEVYVNVRGAFTYEAVQQYMRETEWRYR